MIRHYYLRFSTLIASHTIAVLLFIHIVGVVGLLSPFQDTFRQLTPFTLLVSAILILISHRNPSTELYWFTGAVFLLGFAIEYIGVHTGMLFGHYEYGKTLGLKIDGVPLIIGINWFLIMYCVAVLTDVIAAPVTVKVLLGASLAVAIDFLIEPVAMKYGFWSWRGDVVPFQNYVGWFFTSVIMISIFHLLRVKVESRMALPYYFIQIFFFLLISLLQ